MRRGPCGRAWPVRARAVGGERSACRGSDRARADLARGRARLRPDPGSLRGHRPRPGSPLERRLRLRGRRGRTPRVRRHDVQHLLDLQALHERRRNAGARRRPAPSRRARRQAPFLVPPEEDGRRRRHHDRRPSDARLGPPARVGLRVLVPARLSLPDARADRGEDRLAGGALSARDVFSVFEPGPVACRRDRRRDLGAVLRRLCPRQHSRAAEPQEHRSGNAGGRARQEARDRLHRSGPRGKTRADPLLPGARDRGGRRLRFDGRGPLALRLVAIPSAQERRRRNPEGDDSARDASRPLGRAGPGDAVGARLCGDPPGQQDLRRPPGKLSRVPHSALPHAR